MKTETFRINESQLDSFKDACKKSSIEFINYDGKEVEIQYRYPHNLFFLGQQFQLAKRIKELESC